MKKTFETWNFSPPMKNQIEVIDFVNKMIKNFNYPKKMIKLKKMSLYESKDLNLSSSKAITALPFSILVAKYFGVLRAIPVPLTLADSSIQRLICLAYIICSAFARKIFISYLKCDN